MNTRQNWFPLFRLLPACGPAIAFGAVLLLPLAVMAPPAHAEDQQTSPSAASDSAGKGDKSSLDDKLLDDLDDGLLEGLGDLPPLPNKKEDPARPAAAAARPDQPEQPKTGPKTTTALDDKLLDQLGEGEDVQLGEQDDPLTRIGKRMRNLEQLISGQNTSEKTQQLQQEIVDDLAVLIKRASQKRQRSSGGNPPKTPAPRSQDVQQPDQQPGEGAEGQASQRGTQSTDRLGKGENAEIRREEVHSLMKRAWGHYPDRVREEMLNAAVERFLPKYEKLIEDYFKRLAEDDSTSP